MFNDFIIMNFYSCGSNILVGSMTLYLFRLCLNGFKAAVTDAFFSGFER